MGHGRGWGGVGGGGCMKKRRKATEKQLKFTGSAGIGKKCLPSAGSWKISKFPKTRNVNNRLEQAESDFSGIAEYYVRY